VKSTKNVASTLNVVASGQVDVTLDLEKTEGKCIAKLLDEQKETQEENNATE
tara:strand:- start:313 stop:468 length:156 start_codon:yes stop_codon:yes gene_type:complete